MKNTILTIALVLTTLMSFSQAQYGIQGGVNYNFSGNLTDLNELGSATDDIIHGADKSVGYHGGLWLKYDFSGMFIKGEALYTKYKTDFLGTQGYYMTTKKIDVPVVLGMKVLGPVYIFAGPDLQYIMNEDFSLGNTDVKFDDFTLGLHIGAGLELGRVSLDVRWDKGLTGSNSEILNSSVITDNFTLDNRPNQLVFSLHYALSEGKK